VIKRSHKAGKAREVERGEERRVEREEKQREGGNSRLGERSVQPHNCPSQQHPVPRLRCEVVCVGYMCDVCVNTECERAESPRRMLTDDCMQCRQGDGEAGRRASQQQRREANKAMAYRSTSRVKAKKGKGPINYEVFPQTRQVVSVEELLAAVEIDSEMVSEEPTRARN
jgi:hypothetical protein